MAPKFLTILADFSIRLTEPDTTAKIFGALGSYSADDDDDDLDDDGIVG